MALDTNLYTRPQLLSDLHPWNFVFYDEWRGRDWELSQLAALGDTDAAIALDQLHNRNLRQASNFAIQSGSSAIFKT